MAPPCASPPAPCGKTPAAANGAARHVSHALDEVAAKTMVTVRPQRKRFWTGKQRFALPHARCIVFVAEAGVTGAEAERTGGQRVHVDVGAGEDTGRDTLRPEGGDESFPWVVSSFPKQRSPMGGVGDGIVRSTEQGGVLALVCGAPGLALGVVERRQPPPWLRVRARQLQATRYLYGELVKRIRIWQHLSCEGRTSRNGAIPRAAQKDRFARIGQFLRLEARQAAGSREWIVLEIVAIRALDHWPAMRRFIYWSWILGPSRSARLFLELPAYTLQPTAVVDFTTSVGAGFASRRGGDSGIRILGVIRRP
ncbi:hypothetical protein C8R47DRAFT_1073258 [Mycena vitilis]|nr:hypothetical protein C8R47DRAFT_1073258 [Mycena vitilis]